MNILQYIAIGLVALVLVVNPWLTLGTRIILLGVLLVGSYLWLNPRDPREEQEREANEARWQQEQAQNEQPHDQHTRPDTDHM